MTANTITLRPAWIDFLDLYLPNDVSNMVLEHIPFIPSPFTNDAPLLALPEDFASAKLPRAFASHPATLSDLASFYGLLLIAKMHKTLASATSAEGWESAWRLRLQQGISINALRHAFPALAEDLDDPEQPLPEGIEGVISWLLDQARTQGLLISRAVNLRLAETGAHPSVTRYMAREKLVPFLPPLAPLFGAVDSLKRAAQDGMDEAAKQVLVKSIHAKLREMGKAMAAQEELLLSIQRATWTDEEMFGVRDAITEFAEDKPMSGKRIEEVMQPGGRFAYSKGLLAEEEEEEEDVK